MLNKSVAIAFILILAVVTISKSKNIRIVEQNTQKVIDSIVLGIGDSNTYCVQKFLKTEDKEEWVTISAAWHIPASIDTIPPMAVNRSCLYIQGKKTVNDKIIVKNENDSLIIPLTILPGDSLKRIEIRLVTPPNNRYLGDTIKTLVRIGNENGLLEGNLCLDSMYYTLLNSVQNETKSEIIVNNTKRAFKSYTKQCFSDGIDTLAIILNDSSFIGNTFRISVLHRSVSDTTDESSLLPANSISNFSGHLNGNKWFVFFLRDGLIQFVQNITAPLTISVIKTNGQLIHSGIYVPNKNNRNQYVIPVSMMATGCYLLNISSKINGSIYCGMMVR